MVTQHRADSAPRASTPWSGQSRTEGLGSYGPDPTRPQKYLGHYAEVLSRRTPAWREAALQERLDQLRAQPPIGRHPYPTA